ncbi:unnamed protein product [Didymodactylos carnosus]|uniref:Uncharacterized protein n=1 Tax=Didymodactylos carnosus TaxID=1234261 RepID=A0A8S2QJ40_9BILA|nr:unnamed protein product [Didymodactylos carnosus]CAF4116151.1 unnamed protein product [Didymodactylos carnosus]
MRPAYAGSSTGRWQATLDPGSLSPNSDNPGYRVSWSRDFPRSSLTYTQELAIQMLREQERLTSASNNSTTKKQ